MSKPYSMDLRRRVIDYYRHHKPMSQKAVSIVFAIGVATIGRWLRRERETGGLHPIVGKAGRKGALSEEDHKRLRQVLDEVPDRTLAGLASDLNQHRTDAISHSTISRALKKLRLTRKKKHFVRRSTTQKLSNRS